MGRREAVKLACNGKGYFNTLFYGYWCQYYLREGESKGGGKGCGVVKKANKLQHVEIVGSEGRKARVADVAAGHGGTQKSQGLEPQTFPCPLLMGWQLLLWKGQPELPKSRLGNGEKGSPAGWDCLEVSHGPAKPSPSVCISVFGLFLQLALVGLVPVLLGQDGQRGAHRDLLLKWIFHPEPAGNAFTPTRKISDARQPPELSLQALERQNHLLSLPQLQQMPTASTSGGSRILFGVQSCFWP